METIMPFGKHQNDSMEELPSGYLKWVMENWEDEDIREAAEEEWLYRNDTKSHWD